MLCGARADLAAEINPAAEVGVSGGGAGIPIGRQHAIKLQTARSEYERRRQQWSTKRIEAESLGRVIDRFRKEERQISDQREQREGDDAAMRISLARLEAGNS